MSATQPEPLDLSQRAVAVIDTLIDRYDDVPDDTPEGRRRRARLDRLALEEREARLAAQEQVATDAELDT
ncbi:MAG: hypothetical protein OXR64_09875 [Chloroflexota bacterium]|nr:hypothetical protein [Chloroflexota bacterium]MDE2920140.1 hypothetical protein [Chloroflexota bacterium]